MAYLRKVKNREGRIYYHIAQSYRKGGKVRYDLVKYIGRHDVLALSHKDPEKHAREVLAQFNSGSEESLEIVKKFLITADRTVARENIGYLLLDNIYTKLDISKILSDYSKSFKFKYSLDEIMRLLVFGRILSPKSKSSTVENFKHTLFGDWRVEQNDMDRSLDHFDKVKDDVQFIIHKSISKNIGRTAKLVFYDVTNYYFETDIDDDFRKRGPSKEHRPNPIVQMGLFMDSNGIPIAYKLFKGNHTDPITYIPAIEQVKKQFGIQRIITVADKAMNSARNVADAAQKGDGWLFSQKFRGKQGSPKDIQEFLLDKRGWEYSQNMGFAKKSMIRKRKIAKGVEVQEKVLVTWKEKYANREKIRRDGAVGFANGLRNPEKYRQTMRKGGKKYLKMTLQDLKTGEMVLAHPHLDIDQDLVDFDAQFDGFNVIVTSETKMSDADMIDAYGELSQIEDCFRVTKTELNARPVYVWKKEHIEAHFLTCFIALVVLRFLQYKLDWKFSVRRIIDALNSMSAKHIKGNYYETEASDDAVEILKKLGADWRKEVQTKVAIKELKNLA